MMKTEEVLSMYCSNCSMEIEEDSRFCSGCGARVEPDWDTFVYDSDTPFTSDEERRLVELATDEEWLDEFELDLDEHVSDAAYCRRTLAIVEWRRTNGL